MSAGQPQLVWKWVCKTKKYQLSRKCTGLIMVTDYYSSLSSFTQLHTLLTTTLLIPPPTHTHTPCTLHANEASKQQLWSASTVLLTASLQINLSVLHTNKWDVMQPGGGGERGGGGENGPPAAVRHRAVRKPGSKTCQQTGRVTRCLSRRTNSQHTASVHLSIYSYVHIQLWHNLHHFDCVCYHTGFDMNEDVFKL